MAAQHSSKHAFHPTSYDIDIVAWANEQARFLREGRFDLLDIEHLAEEIEGVGKSEQRELSCRMAVLLAHLLRWQYQQPERRSNSWRRTIKEQRRAIAKRPARTPSLKSALSDPDWIETTWADALTLAIQETGLDIFPEDCPWTVEQVLDSEFLPE